MHIVLLFKVEANSFVIRDRYGIRPLSLGKLKSGGYIVASETCAFDLVGAEFIRDVRPGEMLIFSEEDDIESVQLLNQNLDHVHLSMCILLDQIL